LQWRKRLDFMSFYPQDYLQKKAYQLILLFFLVCVIGGSFAFHAAHADDGNRGDGDTAVVDGVSYLSPKLLDQLYDHPTLRQSGARSCRAIFVLGQRRAESSTFLVEAQTSLEQAKARQESLQGRVGYADIRAPETGIVSALHIKTIGAVVQAGTVLTEIVPVNAEHVVRARLLPQDVADVTLGQRARISLSAYDVSRYGALEGEVVHVASNTTEEQNVPPYYETMIAIGDKGFPNSNIEPEIVPGMQVTVDIIGGKRTVLDYILSPIQKAAAVAFREK